MKQSRQRWKSGPSARGASAGWNIPGAEQRWVGLDALLPAAVPEELYQRLFQLSPEGMALADGSGRILAVNRAWCRMLGYSRPEVLGQAVHRFLPVQEWSETGESAVELRGGRSLEREVWCRRKDGERCLVRVHEQWLSLPEGGSGVLLVARDITRSRQGERLCEVFLSLAENLSRARERQQAARAIFAAADQLWKWDRAVLELLAPEPGRVETVLACQVVEGRRQEIDATTPPHAEVSPGFRHVLARGAELILHSARAGRADGFGGGGEPLRRFASVMVVPVWAEDQPVGVLSVQSYAPNAYTQEDLRALQALAEYCGGAFVRIRAEAESHRLGRQILHISEQEQARIGQDLHDGLCQNLVSLAFDVQLLQSTLAGQERPEAQVAQRLGECLDQAITECRQVSRGLFPVRMATEGLPSALEELVKASGARFRVHCRFFCPQPVRVADGAVATHLFRIAQEALTNALRHSRADRVTMRLLVEDGLLCLTVEDEGVGLSSGVQRRAKGLGLHIMGYRARAIGGTLQIESRPQGGTRVICTVACGGRGREH